MDKIFTLKNPKDNINLLAFQYHTLEYSIEVLKKRKEELKSNPILKNKINNYLLMERLSFEQDLKREDLPFDIKKNIKDYLHNPNNNDLKNYMSICKHIVAKELDMAEICSRVSLNDHMFIVRGNDLFCVDCNLSTFDSIYNDIEKKFLYSCAKREKRIIRVENTAFDTNVSALYNTASDNDMSNLVQVA